MCTLLQSLLPCLHGNRLHSRFSPLPETMKTMTSGVLLDFRKQFIKVCEIVWTSIMTAGFCLTVWRLLLRILHHPVVSPWRFLHTWPLQHWNSRLDCNLSSLFVFFFNWRTPNCHYIIQHWLFFTLGVSGVWLSPVGAALGDRPVSVRWPALPRLLWSSSGWWHCLPVPAFSAPCTLDTEGSPARPGERPSSQSSISVCIDSPTHYYYLYQWPLICGQEALQHPTFQTPY